MTEIEAWLLAEPHLSAAEVLARLTAKAPATFTSNQLRTVQRLVRTSRRKAALQFLDNGVAALAPMTSALLPFVHASRSVAAVAGNIVP